MQPDSDIADFIEALRPVKVGRNNYTRLDRYRDFRAVFGSEQGKRVLSQIIDASEGGVIAEADAESHARLAFRAGMRRVGALIAAWATIAPPEDAPEQGES